MNYLEYINLDEWKTKKEIINELSIKNIDIDERSWRKVVKEHNQKFYTHELDTFIAHSSKGYKLTTNVEEIKESIKDNHKRALDMLYEESKIKKAIGENYNMKLVINNNEFIVMEE